MRLIPWQHALVEEFNRGKVFTEKTDLIVKENFNYWECTFVKQKPVKSLKYSS